MKKLSVNDIIKQHSKLIKITGGLDGVRDENMLENSVMNCYQTFDSTELYPTVVEKASRLAYSLCHNHPFIDGNKRIAILSYMLMLNLNGLTIKATQNELIELGLSMANGIMSYDDVLMWTNEHLIKNS